MLLRYGSNNDDVRRLQEGLAAFGFHPGAADGVFGNKTADAVESWQHKAGIYPDGVFGKGSMARWNRWCDENKRPEYKFGEPDSPPAEPSKTDSRSWTVVPADALKGGYSRLTLRDDTAEAYMRVYSAVHDLGGVLTSAGGKRSLASKAGASRSTKSFHYTGRALDLALPTGMQDIVTDPYIVVRDGSSRKFVVWAKVLNETAIKAHSVPTVNLIATTVVKKKDTKGRAYTQLVSTPWEGKAFNLTELFNAQGFVRISGRKSFFEGGAYTGAEWWHFQWVTGLVEGQTTFGEELLRVYSLPECKRFVYWNEAKDAVYQVSWF